MKFRVLAVPSESPQGAIGDCLGDDKLVAVLGSEDGQHYYIVTDGVPNPRTDPALRPAALARAIVGMLNGRGDGC